MAREKATGGQIVNLTEDRLPFAKVPAVVLRDGDLSAGARLLYGALMWLSWRQAWRDEPGYQGQEAVGEEFGLSPRSVSRYMGELIEAGYIAFDQVGQGEPANVTLLPLPEPDGEPGDE